MTNFDKEKFLNPERKYRVNPMMHMIAFNDDPTDGSVRKIKAGDRYTVPSFRSVFVVFD